MTYEAWDPRTVAALCLVAIATVAVSAWAELLVARLVIAFDWFVLVAGLGIWAVWGRDPIALDDDSVLAAGPPAGLTPCLAVILHDGRGEDRALEVALLELAERGLVEIHDDPLVGNGAYIPRAWIDVKGTSPHQLAAAMLDFGPPERVLATALGVYQRGSARLDIVDTLAAIGSARSEFEAAVDGELVSAEWYRRPPFRTMRAWLRLADVVFVLGVVGSVVAILVASAPLLFAYAGLVFVGWLGRWVALAMPARTRSGALVVAMLKAYRRSLEKTLRVAESVWDVIGVRELAWFETPDRMIVWAMALNLERDLAAMFARANDAPSGEPWFPDWYGTTVTEPGRMFRSLDQLVPRSASRGLLSRR